MTVTTVIGCRTFTSHSMWKIWNPKNRGHTISCAAPIRVRSVARPCYFAAVYNSPTFAQLMTL